jgi:predicted MFS family arabinose efflux permease
LHIFRAGGLTAAGRHRRSSADAACFPADKGPLPMTEPAAAMPPPANPGRLLTFAMAAACGIAVANIYYNQPLLGLIERNYPGSAAIGLVPTATQLGYAVGLFLLVPLGDLVERRRLIVLQFLALAGTLVLAALAPTTATLIAASLLLGAAASVAQQILPFAANLAPPQTRGAVLGTVMSGLLCGILLSRTLAGFVGAHLGWRSVFWAGVPLALLGAALMAATLPRSHPAARTRYPDALRSLAQLWREETPLRRATMTQAAIFGSFSAFWTILALRLEEPIFRLGADVAGLFGIIGVIGVFAAPLAGRVADRRGPQLVVALGAAATFAAWLLFGLWGTIAGLIGGVILLDFGVQSALVSNQHRIYALRPEARSRLNTVFMTGNFIGGSIGSIGATAAYHLIGWTGVSAWGAFLALIASLLQVRNRLPRPCPAPGE